PVHSRSMIATVPGMLPYPARLSNHDDPQIDFYKLGYWSRSSRFHIPDFQKAHHFQSWLLTAPDSDIRWIVHSNSHNGDQRSSENSKNSKFPHPHMYYRKIDRYCSRYLSHDTGSKADCPRSPVYHPGFLQNCP